MNKIKLSIRDCFIFSLRGYKTKFKKIITACLIMYLISWLSNCLLYLPYGIWFMKGFNLIFGSIIGGGLSFYFLKLFREEPVTIKNLWIGFGKIIPVWIVIFIPLMVIAVWFLLFMISRRIWPTVHTFGGIFVIVLLLFCIWLTRYTFGVLAVLDKGQSSIEAFKYSANLVKGNTLKIFIIFAVQILIYILFAILFFNIDKMFTNAAGIILLRLLLSIFGYFFLSPLFFLIYVIAYEILRVSCEDNLCS